jgi:integrase
LTLAEAAAQFLAGAEDGSIRRKDGRRYAPATVRSYERSLRLRLLPELGQMRLSQINRADVIHLVRLMMGEELHPVTIDTTLNPLRAIITLHLDDQTLTVNPTAGVKLPRAEREQQRYADPAEAAKLLASLPADERALWATALYAGLRRGELRALRWSDMDLAQGVIRVERGWDEKEGEQQTKGRNRRRVPITAILRDYLVEHGMASGRSEGFVFGRSATEPFRPETVTARADAAWKEAGLDRITLHACCHTFASMMIAAGVNAKALQSYMGHSSIQVTYDKYGHLMPGNEEQAAGLLDEYLQRAAEEAARVGEQAEATSVTD